MRYFTCLAFFFSLSLVVLVSGRLSAQVNQPAASAAALAYGQYADIPVNNFTGTGSVTVPIHTVTDGPLSLPIFLQYHTAGNVVSSPASSVGLGWNLNSGGMISRTVRDKIDDGERGYYHEGYKVDLPNGNEMSTEDSEPDLFTYSVAGQSGKFFFDAQQNVHTVPKSDLAIKPIFDGNSNFDGFRITLTDGTRYHFGQYTNVQGVSSRAHDLTNLANDDDINSRGLLSDKHRNGWFLLAITSPDRHHEIRIDYTPTNYIVNTNLTCSAEFKYRENDGGINQASFCPDSEEKRYLMVKSFLPNRITTSSSLVEVDFDYSERLDVRERRHNRKGYKLDEIQITSADFCVKHEFYNGYFADDEIDEPYSKLKLFGVRRLSCDESLAEPYWYFSYHGKSTTYGRDFAPASSNRDIDH